MFGEIQVNFYLSGKRFVMTHPPLFTPVNSSAVTSQADQNTPLIPVNEAKVTGKPEKPINPFRKAAEGMASDAQYCALNTVLYLCLKSPYFVSFSVFVQVLINK